MKKYLLIGFLLGANLLQAKQWYVVNGDALQCEKHEFSPFDYKNSVGGSVNEKDGIYLYTTKDGRQIWFGTSMKKCNWIVNKIMKK